MIQKVQSVLRSTSIQRWLHSSVEEGCWDTLIIRHVSSTPQVLETTTPPTQRDACMHELALQLQSHLGLCSTRVGLGSRQDTNCTHVLSSGRKPWVAHQRTEQHYNVIHLTTETQVKLSNTHSTAHSIFLTVAKSRGNHSNANTFGYSNMWKRDKHNTTHPSTTHVNSLLNIFMSVHLEGQTRFFGLLL